MWLLLRSQIRYHSWWLGPVLLAVVLLGVGLGLAEPDLETELDAWFSLVLVGGVISGSVIWNSDQRERRLLLWLTLSVRPASAHAARLLLVLFLPASIVLLSVPILWWSHGTYELPWLLNLLGIQGLCLAAIYLMYFGEEVNVRIADKQALLWAFNFGLPLGIVAVAFFTMRMETPLSSPAQVLGWHAVALVLGLTSLVLFRTRPSYLLGTDCTGWRPQDWSESADA